MPEKATQGRWMLDSWALNTGAPHKPISDEAKVLKARIIDGHNKLWERWRIIRAMDKDDPRLPRCLEVWDRACDRLEALCDDLVATGFRDCLYPPDYKAKSFCLVCPKDPWTPETCLCWEVEP